MKPMKMKEAKCIEQSQPANSVVEQGKRAHHGTEAILNFYVHVNTNALTLSLSFYLQQCASKGLQELFLTFNSSYVSVAQQCLLVGLQVKQTFR